MWEIVIKKSDGSWRIDPRLCYHDLEFALEVAASILAYDGREAACICWAGS